MCATLGLELRPLLFHKECFCPLFQAQLITFSQRVTSAIISLTISSYHSSSLYATFDQYSWKKWYYREIDLATDEGMENDCQNKSFTLKQCVSCFWNIIALLLLTEQPLSFNSTCTNLFPHVDKSFYQTILLLWIFQSSPPSCKGVCRNAQECFSIHHHHHHHHHHHVKVYTALSGMELKIILPTEAAPS